MKHTWKYLLFCCWLPGMAQQVGTSPLEYNPQKFFHSYGTMTDVQEARSLYPIGSKNFYIYDTLSLPFVDDFSQYHFKNYDPWSWPAPVDSIALIYRLTPLPAAFPFRYSYDTTYTYSYDTIPALHVDSVLNPSYQLVFFGDSLNPFEPVDTQTVFEVTTYRYYINSLTLAIDSTVITAVGTLGADSTDTIHVYFPLPDNAYWVDNYVYPNFSMGVDPPTIGVATFDGTNEYGKAYQPGAISSYGIADYLTSKPIDLKYPVSDSIYFSFFYQPQGLGYDPATKDSLVVEFYSPVTEKWHYILKIPGTALDTFRQEMVPVTDTVFLQKGFRLRFKNHANLSGNLDHWNIDYVRLDRNRNHADTIIQDVAFVQVQPTILRRYMAMPYTQFKQTNVDAKWNNLLCNLGDVDKTICYKFELADESGNILNRYTEDYTPVPSDTNTIQPRSLIGYTTFSRWYEPDFNYSFDLSGMLPLTDSTEFTVKHYLQNFSVDTNIENDTVLIRQRFWNYYAYDDGTAEQAIWLGTPGYMAVKFTNNYPDTLRAIQFYFSPIKEDVSSRFFNIMVWVDNLDSLVYNQSRQIGVIQGDPSAEVNPNNNGFSTFYLQDTVILPAGDFYVGWYQNQTYKINVGFDLNTNSSQYIFYKTTSEWDTLDLDGSMMIRPMVGPPFRLQDVGVEPVEENNEGQLVVYPNPTHDMLYYAGDLAADVKEIRVMDVSGKLIVAEKNPSVNRLDLTAYPNGFYFVQFGLQGSNRIITRKIIVSH